jgi:hypothetical protein
MADLAPGRSRCGAGLALNEIEASLLGVGKLREKAVQDAGG